MALIGKIRNNPLIVLLFIGGGIALFVLSDIMNSGNSGAIGPVEALMGRAGEMEIERNDFERTLGAVYTGGDNFQNRDNLWQFYVTEGLIRTEAERIGLAVSAEEMNELTFGNNPSPVIRRNFSDPQTGQINREFLTRVQGYVEDGNIEQGIEDRQLSPNFVPIWKYQRREINTQRLQEKLGALVSKGFYAPSWLAQDFANAQAASRNVALVKVPFDELDNDAVTVGDDQLRAYVEENRSVYDNPEESRIITYVSFEVSPTDADSAAIREKLGEIATEWRSVRNDSLFALANNGSYTGASLGADALSPVIADAIFDEAVAEGDIYGPYLEGNAMKLAKVIAKETLADSARTRHILVAAQTPDAFASAEATVDSLMTVLQRNRGKFAALAEEFSQDPGSAANGGVFERVTPGQFVKPYDDVIFRTGDLNTLYKVRTQFGWHLVEVLSRSRSTSPRAKVAYVVENIEPSIETQEAVDIASQEYLNGKRSLDQLREAAAAAGATVNTTRPLTLNAYNITGLGGGQEVRDMLCWAFSADAGEVSDRTYVFNDPQLFYRRYYVLAGLESVIPKGLAPVDAVRETVEPLVRNRAKGTQLAQQMGGKNLATVAQQYDVRVDTLNRVNLGQTSLPNGIGREPKVIAAASRATTGQVSEPVIGETGVFLVYPLNDAPQTNSSNIPGARSQLNTTARLAVNSALVGGMRAAAEIEDQRGTLECN